MRKLLTLTLAALLGFVLTCALAVKVVQAEEPLPYCAADGDLDGDGIADEIDSDETDSCLASGSGFEDCSTGAGDGIPDCQPLP